MLGNERPIPSRISVEIELTSSNLHAPCLYSFPSCQRAPKMNPFSVFTLAAIEKLGLPRSSLVSKNRWSSKWRKQFQHPALIRSSLDRDNSLLSRRVINKMTKLCGKHYYNYYCPFLSLFLSLPPHLQRNEITSPLYASSVLKYKKSFS